MKYATLFAALAILMIVGCQNQNGGDLGERFEGVSVESEPTRRPVVNSRPVVPGAAATIQRRWLNGDAEKRERLKELEALGVPPGLRLSGWENSRPLSLGDLRGKIVVVDFWATWCPPCIKSIEHNNEMHAKFYDQGVVLIGACCPKGSEDMKDVIRKHRIEYPVAIDSNNNTFAAYKARAFPSYYLIDRQGNLRIADCNRNYLDDAIQFLIDEPTNRMQASLRRPFQPQSGSQPASYLGPGSMSNPFFKNDGATAAD